MYKHNFNLHVITFIQLQYKFLLQQVNLFFADWLNHNLRADFSFVFIVIHKCSFIIIKMTKMRLLKSLLGVMVLLCNTYFINVIVIILLHIYIHIKMSWQMKLILCFCKLLCEILTVTQLKRFRNLTNYSVF